MEPRDVGRMPGTARIWRGGGDDVVAMGLLLDGRWYVERRDASGSGCRAYATRRSALEAAETVMSRGAGDWTEDR